MIGPEADADPLRSRPPRSLPPREWRFRLDHMLEASDQIAKNLAGRRKADLSDDRQLQAAVAWEFQVLGEAVANIPAEVKDRYPDVPWENSRAFRNRIVHRYFDIDLEKLWTIATEELPPLIPLLQGLRDQDAAGPTADPEEPGAELEP